MSYSINVDPLDPAATGLALPNGADKNTITRLVANAVRDSSITPWQEVTGSSPTPAALQSFASTIDDPSTTGYGTTGPAHVTLYDPNDPALSAGTPGARMIRFHSGAYGIYQEYYDGGMAGAAWTGAPVTVQTGSTIGWMILPNLSAFSTASNANTWQPSESYAQIAISDTWHSVWLAYTPASSQYLTNCGGGVWYPKYITDGSAQRDEYPHIYSLNVQPNNNSIGGNPLVEYPTCSNFANTTVNFTVFRSSSLPDTDLQGRHMAMPWTPDFTDYAVNFPDGYLENQWLIIDTPFPASSDVHQVVTIDGSDYFVIGNGAFSAYRVLIPAFNIA